MTEALRRKLTNAGRMLEMENQGDYVAGHVTVRLPDNKSRFLMKPATIGLDEMTSGEHHHRRSRRPAGRRRHAAPQRGVHPLRGLARTIRT